VTFQIHNKTTNECCWNVWIRGKFTGHILRKLAEINAKG